MVRTVTQKRPDLNQANGRIPKLTPTATTWAGCGGFLSDRDLVRYRAESANSVRAFDHRWRVLGLRFAFAGFDHRWRVLGLRFAFAGFDHRWWVLGLRFAFAGADQRDGIGPAREGKGVRSTSRSSKTWVRHKQRFFSLVASSSGYIRLRTSAGRPGVCTEQRESRKRLGPGLPDGRRGRIQARQVVGRPHR
jgi:hypothetical protein